MKKLHKLSFTLILSLLNIMSFAQVNCENPTSQAILDINKVRAAILGGGDLWWNFQNAKYDVPKDSGITSFFAGGLWIGAIDNGGQLRLAAQTYRYNNTSDYFAGPGNASLNCDNYNYHWVINRKDINNHILISNHYNFNIPSTIIHKDILNWPAKGNPYAKGKSGNSITVVDDLAPFVDVDYSGTYDPTKGDYPDVPGDQAIWWIFNDYNFPHTATGGLPLGIDVHALAYAFKSDGIIDYTTFYKYKIINKTNQNLSDMYIGHWTDIAIGYLFDDYVGCDTIRNLGIGYNSEPLVAGIVKKIGTNSSIIGVKFLQTPVNSQGIRPGMTRFMFYENHFAETGNPTLVNHYYNYLTGKWKNDSIWKYYPDVGQPYAINYMVPGKPGNGLTECDENNQPGDRRFLMSSGPYTFNPGDVLELDFAAIWKACPDQIDCYADFDCIGLAADTVQAFFDNVVLTTNIKEPHIKKGQINVYPNPAKDVVNIDCKACISAKEIKVEISDLSGKVQQMEQFSSGSTFSINTSKFAPGIYFISVFDDDQIIGIQKVVIK